ncbi:MAG: integrin alpha, partial [Planctomycetota bacterium]|nr:integrin alpha [Planctomycetota bacterium]
MKILSFTLTSLALCASAEAQQLWQEYSSTSGHQKSLVMGDMNGDSRSDFALVRTVVHPSGFGTAFEMDFVSGATGALLSTWVLPPNASEVEGLGDLTGDGVSEIILGMPLTGGQLGTVDVHDGASQAVLFNYFSGPGENNFGKALADAGDVNADGTPDFIVGIPSYGTPGWDGRIKVYSGATGALLYTRDGAPYSYYGWSVGTAGDVDGDGHDDFMASARGTYSGQIPYPGYVRVYSGATGALLNQIPAIQSEDANPFVIAAAGDLNADGHSDYMVGTPF